MQEKQVYICILSLIIGGLNWLEIVNATERLPAIKSGQLISEKSDYKLEIPAQISLGDEGSDRYNAGKYQEAIGIWLSMLSQTSNQKEKATIYSNLGSAYRQIGNLGEAIAQWKKAAKIYQLLSDRESHQILAQVLMEQAQTYNALGQFRVAVPILQSVVELARKEQKQSIEAAAQGVLGNAYYLGGDLEKAIVAYDRSLNLATGLKNSSLMSINSNNLGNVFQRRYKRYLQEAKSAAKEGEEKEESRLMDLAQKDAAKARSYYELTIQQSQALGGIWQAKALLNLVLFSSQLPSPPQDKLVFSQLPSLPQDQLVGYTSQAIKLIEAAPDSRAKAYTLISATEVGNSTSTSNNSVLTVQQKVKILEKAITIARKIGDQRGESFGLGSLGKIYEQTGNLAIALQLTQQAILSAQQANAGDSLYRWQAQIGRIYKANGQTELAVLSYEEAIATLQNIRRDVVAASKDLQFELRDSVESVYREQIDLLLSQSQSSNSQPKIEEALQVLESLQLNEIQNFFGDECVEIARDRINPNSELAKTNTAVINSIILGDRTYLILHLPDGSLKQYPVQRSRQEIEEQIDQLRVTLEDISSDAYLTESQKVYDWIIKPMVTDLEKAKPRTLLFINDGSLRKVPMAALYDGKQFLIEKYAITTTLGLNLTTRKKPTLANAKALIFGLSVAKPPFSALPNVLDETKGIQKIIGGDIFLDKDFTLANLQKQIYSDNYAIIHIATHGKFGADANDTFLQIFDQRLFLNDFENILRQSKQPIDLLTLSACQTAAGNDRSTLGIAGIALRAGVQTTLASLWYVNDADTVPLMTNFYQMLRQPGITKAEALRQAQLKIIANSNSRHPAKWSAFVLAGNWQ